MQDAAAEARLRRERVIDVERIHIGGDGDEPLHVLVREGLRERGVLPRLEVVDACHGAELIMREIGTIIFSNAILPTAAEKRRC